MQANVEKRQHAGTEVRGLMFLTELFKERGWPNPRYVELEPATAGVDLLARLGIERERVAALFVNHRLYFPEKAVINPGDRVALLPPGGLIFPELGCRKCVVL
jgi:hypothetical protein